MYNPEDDWLGVGEGDALALGLGLEVVLAVVVGEGEIVEVGEGEMLADTAGDGGPIGEIIFKGTVVQVKTFSLPKSLTHSPSVTSIGIPLAWEKKNWEFLSRFIPMGIARAITKRVITLNNFFLSAK